MTNYLCNYVVSQEISLQIACIWSLSLSFVLIMFVFFNSIVKYLHNILVSDSFS